MKWLVRLYPRSWRDRYASELSNLIDDLDPGPGVALDLVRGAVVERLRSLVQAGEPTLRFAEGPSMTVHPWQRHPTAMALMALAIVAPTLAFMTVSFLAYQVGVPGMVTVVEPVVQAVTGPQVVEWFLVGAPFLAFVVAAMPLVGGDLSRAGGEPQLTLRVRLRPLNVTIAVLTVLVGGLLVGYLVSEFLIEAVR